MIDPASIKLKSESRVAALSLPVNTHLPELESPAELIPPPPESVAARAHVLSHLIGVGYGRSGGEMLDWLEKAELLEHVSPFERRFLEQPEHSSQERAWAAWQVPAVYALAWSLGLEELDILGGAPESLASHFPARTPMKGPFLLRPYLEIFEMADLHYRIHWAVRECRLSGGSSLVPEMEICGRRKALDWAVGLPHDWDAIPLDT
jgi:hypothetical protein